MTFISASTAELWRVFYTCGSLQLSELGEPHCIGWQDAFSLRQMSVVRQPTYRNELGCCHAYGAEDVTAICIQKRTLAVGRFGVLCICSAITSAANSALTTMQAIRRGFVVVYIGNKKQTRLVAELTTSV